MKKSVKSIISLVLAITIMFPYISTMANELQNEFDGQVNVNAEDIIDIIEVEEQNESSNEAIEIEETSLEYNEVEKVEEDSVDEVGVGDKYELLDEGMQIATYSVEVFEREEFNLKYPTIATSRYLKKKTSDNYEIALAYSDGSYTYVGSANNFEEAKILAENTSIPYSDEMILPTVINSDGQVVYSTRVMGRIWKHVDGKSYPSFNLNTTLYTNPELTNSYNYVNQGYVDDVPVIEYNDVSAKIQVSGHEAWVNKNTASGNYDLVLIPINQVSNPSYYKVEGGILCHFISSDLTSKSQRGTTLKIGPAPGYLQEGVRYLSYDGRYFYDGSNISNGLDSLIRDLQEGHKNNSINVNNAYFNYYNYLPFRSRTMYTADDINKFIEVNTKDTSKLRGTGQAFIDAQNIYGVNALLALGVGINESAWGESKIAHNKNNIFGIKAFDSSPGESADYFRSVADSIIEFCNHYISRGYADPADWRYFGGFLGNKDMGANIKYASDPFWGEKAASYAFRADMYLSGENIYNLKDFNAFQIIMFTGENKVKLSDNTLLYKIYDSVNGYTAKGGKKGTTAIITNKSEEIVNGDYCLEVYPERNTSINNGGSENKYHGNYDWNKKAYIESKNIIYINTPKQGAENIDITYANKWKKYNGKWYYYNEKGVKCKGWKEIDKKWYYLNITTGEMVTDWKLIDGEWYYFNQSGSMAKGWIKLNKTWYYLNNHGAMVTGWINIDGEWYYLNEDGEMATGIIQVNGKYYYLNGDGKMQTRWQYVDGTWYYFYDNGAAAIGWLKDRGTWYYLYEDGKMATGLIKVKGKYYYLNDDGKMQTGWHKISRVWYHFNEDGAATVGWLNYKGTWYYLYEDGKMATGIIQVDGKYYYLNGDGKMQTRWQHVDGVWYYFQGNGAAVIGWNDINGKRYYFYEDGKMAADTVIDGVYVDHNGAAQ